MTAPLASGQRSLAALTVRAAMLASAAFVIVGPLASLAVWSVAERWTYPSAWPQRIAPST